MEVHTYNLYLIMDKDPDSFDSKSIYESSIDFCNNLGLKVLSSSMHLFTCPLGKEWNNKNNKTSHSGVFLLSTSHLAWHTFPEDNLIHLNLSTCGEKIEVEFFKRMIIKHYRNVKEIRHAPCF